MTALEFQDMNGLGMWFFNLNKFQNPSGPIGSVRSDRTV